MEQFKFGDKMESFTDEQLKDRIRQAYEQEMPKLRIVPYIGEVGEVVTYDYGELVARCPVTGILDTYRLIIDFIPDEGIPELKTFKYYLMAFDPLPISHEHLCSKIYIEFKNQVKPKKLYVRLLTAVRGGVYTTIQLGDKEISTDLKTREVHG